jgi:hypothetical protein
MTVKDFIHIEDTDDKRQKGEKIEYDKWSG